MEYELYNSALIDQCSRIRKLIKQVSKMEYGRQIYGARYHHY